jgi:hypothetical protein
MPNLQTTKGLPTMKLYVLKWQSNFSCMGTDHPLGLALAYAVDPIELRQIIALGLLLFSISHPQISTPLQQYL